VDDVGVDDDTYLAESGIDPEAVAGAGEREAGGSASREETVRAALRELDDPTEDDVVAYASERGVPEEYTRTALRKLVRAGEVSESRGVYRLL